MSSFFHSKSSGTISVAEYTETIAVFIVFYMLRIYISLNYIKIYIDMIILLTIPTTAQMSENLNLSELNL